MSEYLKRFGLELIKNYSWQEILESGEPIDRKTLSEFLIRANEFLTTEPGPHLAQRRQYSTDWLTWWIEYIEGARMDRRPLCFCRLIGFEDMLTRTLPRASFLPGDSRAIGATSGPLTGCFLSSNRFFYSNKTNIWPAKTGKLPFYL